ncbi:methyltransferase [Candidatus Woesearchaeota archaeon]|jgi:putative methylase|nr:methyltransferase [Candidatus Woesearchaeota archaeon]MBT6774963.1 methyltransferase [Candidatus Woesearchaeota archaeon]
MVRSKKDLEVQLSKLKNFSEPSLELEQYATPDTIAADWIWQMALRGEVAGKTFLDAASGPGIIGIALLLMGAKKIYFVDMDESAMKLCMDNYNQIKEEYEIGEAEFIINDISLFDEEVDITVQNPPFGTKTEHADKKFLEKAFSVSKVVYSMHKYSTKAFVEAIAKDFKFEITNFWRYDFPIKATFMHHKKPVKMVDVGLWRMEKV